MITKGSAGETWILDRVSDRIIRMTSGRMILAALAGFLVSAALVNGRPFGIAQLKEITGGIGILDMEVLYTPDQAYALFSAMGSAGRAFDLTRIIPLDMLVPFFYALFLSTLISWLLHRWLPAASRWHRLNVIPVAGGICDYLENLGVIALLVAWPARTPEIAWFTMIAGLFKFTFSLLAALVIAGALAGWAAERIRARARGAAS